MTKQQESVGRPPMMESTNCELMSQSDARREARRLNEAGEAPLGTAMVAAPWPLGSWSGTQAGWTVVPRPI